MRYHASASVKTCNINVAGMSDGKGMGSCRPLSQIPSPLSLLEISQSEGICSIDQRSRPANAGFTSQFLWLPSALLQGEISSQREQRNRVAGGHTFEIKGNTRRISFPRHRSRRLGEFQSPYVSPESSAALFLVSRCQQREIPCQKLVLAKNQLYMRIVFDPTTNPLNVPIVQVSLPASSSPKVHYAFGQALAPLRAQNIVIIGSGMSVHNLRDLFRLPANKQPPAYSVSFDKALRAAVESEIPGREERMLALVERPDARSAHPTFDHFWPVVVACGAGSEEKGERIWGMGEGSVGWAMFRWGDVSA